MSVSPITERSSTGAIEAVEAGRAAWHRLRGRSRAAWSDWLLVAKAIQAGREHALQVAGARRPFGKRYTAAFATWLTENKLTDVTQQERYALLRILENLPAIEVWRAGLEEETARRWNHPDAVLVHWRRATRTTPTHAVVHRTTEPAAHPRPRYDGNAMSWPDPVVERVADALREKERSGDYYVMALAALRAAVPSRDALDELLAFQATAPRPLQAPSSRRAKRRPASPVAAQAHAA